MSALEIAWFGALCDDDYEQLGVVNPDLRSSWNHCSALVLEAEKQGFDSVLLPSGYALGLDTTTMSAALARATSKIRLLTAIRTGENWPPQLARQIATLQHLSDDRIDINIISSDLAGEELASGPRYQRTLEVMEILDALGTGRSVSRHSDFFELDVDPPRIVTGNRPAFYFGGLSDPAKDVAARMADVYLMWPDTTENIAALIDEMRIRASEYGRVLRFGYRVHVIVRETEQEARDAAEFLVAELDDEIGRAIRERSLDSGSVGVARQSELRDQSSDDGYAEPNLWTGIGRGRSGCGAAIVGSVDQVVAKIEAYQELGIEALILSGYPHIDECKRFGELVLPRLSHGPLH